MHVNFIAPRHDKVITLRPYDRTALYNGIQTVFLHSGNNDAFQRYSHTISKIRYWTLKVFRYDQKCEKCV